MLDPAFSNLSANAIEGLNQFESRGCAGFKAYAQDRHESLAIADVHGTILCGAAPPALSEAAASNNAVQARLVGNVTVWSAPAVSASGKNYIFVAVVPVHREQHSWFEDLYHFASPQLPVA